MRAPKGFGSRYFSLGAIQAYSGAVTLHRCAVRTHDHHRRTSVECEAETDPEEEGQPVAETTAPARSAGRRPCHCNLHFHRLARSALRSHRRPRHSVSPYRYTHSTLSPPKRRRNDTFNDL